MNVRAIRTAANAGLGWQRPRDIATAVIGAPLCVTDCGPKQNRNFTSNTHQRPPIRHTMPLIDPLSAVRSVVREAGIVPDVIPDKAPFTPEALLVVKWPTGKEAMLGNTLTAVDTADEPSVSFTPMQSSAAATDVRYTLVMTDPDAPSRSDPKMGQWRHWVVSRRFGCAGGRGWVLTWTRMVQVTGLKAPAWSALDTGDLGARVTRPATTPYFPPAPPRGTGPHRYGERLQRPVVLSLCADRCMRSFFCGLVFLLYQEPGTDFVILTDEQERKSGTKDRAKWNAASFATKYNLKLVGVNYVVVRGDE